MGRAPEQALVRFEHDPEGTSFRGAVPLPAYLDHALRLLGALILRAPARSLFLQPRYKAPTLIYTGASFEKDAPVPCRLGAVCFSERRRRPLGITAVVAQPTLDALLVREQQITQVETLAAPLVLDEEPELLRDTDALWFVDNAGAEAGLLQGYPGSLGSVAMLGLVH